VLIVGAGGLGCPAALYLAAAGVGTIGIVDPDLIDASNLQRQILYRHADVGKEKAKVAAERLREVNPLIEVRPFPVALDATNAEQVMRDFDLVLDATDNFNTRYLINDACFFLGVPNVFASVTRFEGRLSVFCAKDGPCYRCLYPHPPEEVILNCADEGILSVVPGVLGTLQALEAVRLLVGIGESLSGGLLVFDFTSMHSRRLSMKANSDCPLCGTEPTITKIVDADSTCNMASIAEIDSHELQRLLEASEPPCLIDVRETEEFLRGSLPGAISVPLSQIIAGHAGVPVDKKTVLFCQTGRRSQTAAKYLIRSGVPSVFSLSRGIQGVGSGVFPSYPTPDDL